MNFERYARPEPRIDTPVMVRLSKTDRERLQLLAKRTKVPMSTIAYEAIRHMLETEFAEGGAQ